MPAAAILWIAGCGGSGGTAMPPVNPADAANKAIELLDKDGSGSLSQSELAASSGMLAARAGYDTDGNQEVSATEITEHLNTMYERSAPFVGVTCQVMVGGRPLSGATVRFLPEPFLEDSLLPAEGTTDNFGRVSPAVAQEHLPDDWKGLNVMQPGVYRVEVQHPSVKTPHKPLGWEVNELVRGGIEPVLNL